MAILRVISNLGRSGITVTLFQLLSLRVKLRAFPIDGYLAVGGGAILN